MEVNELLELSRTYKLYYLQKLGTIKCLNKIEYEFYVNVRDILNVKTYLVFILVKFSPQNLRIIYLFSMDQKVDENEKEYLQIIKFDRQFHFESCKNFSSFSDLTLRSSVDFVLV